MLIGIGAAYLLAPALPDRQASTLELESVVDQRLLPYVSPEPFTANSNELEECLPAVDVSDFVQDPAPSEMSALYIAKAWIEAEPKLAILQRRPFVPGAMFRVGYDRALTLLVPALRSVQFLLRYGRGAVVAKLLTVLGRLTLWLENVSIGTSAESSARYLRMLTNRRYLQVLTDARVPKEVASKITWSEHQEADATRIADASSRAKFWNQVRQMATRADSPNRRLRTPYDELVSVKQLSDLFIESMNVRSKADEIPDYPVFRKFTWLCNENQISSDLVQLGRSRGWFADRRRRTTPNYFGMFMLSTFAPFDGTGRRILAEIRLTKLIEKARQLFDDLGRWPSEEELERAGGLLEDPFDVKPLHWSKDARTAWSVGVVGGTNVAARLEDRIVAGGGVESTHGLDPTRPNFGPMLSAPPGPKH